MRFDLLLFTCISNCIFCYHSNKMNTRSKLNVKKKKKTENWKHLMRIASGNAWSMKSEVIMFENIFYSNTYIHFCHSFEQRVNYSAFTLSEIQLFEWFFDECLRFVCLRVRILFSNERFIQHQNSNG